MRRRSSSGTSASVPAAIDRLLVGKNGQTLFNNAGQNTQLIYLISRLMQESPPAQREWDGLQPDPITRRSRAGSARRPRPSMAYMLSAQRAAMELSVLNGKVDGDSLIYAPGTESANDLEFATVNDVMSEADGDHLDCTG